MNTNTIETPKKRTFKKRYHFGRDCPCRFIQVPEEIMPEIEKLLSKWQRPGWTPDDDGVEYVPGHRTSPKTIEARIQSAVASEIEKRIPVTPPIDIESVKETIVAELQQTVVVETTPVIESPVVESIESRLSSLENQMSQVLSVLEDLKGKSETPSRLPQGSDAQQPHSCVAAVSELVTTDKPTAKTEALRLHHQGLSASAISLELERLGYLSAAKKRIDPGVISRWIRSSK